MCSAVEASRRRRVRGRLTRFKMEWILKSPQIHSAFASLGYTRGDIYHVNDNCLNTLEGILKSIINEDKCLRTYRRTISFGQNVSKDLMPLLMHSKDFGMTRILIKIMVNLTIPVEHLLDLDITKKTDFGRHTIFELRNLLNSCKNTFTDPRATKTVIDYLKKNCECSHLLKLSGKQCEHIHDCLTLLRNVLHIPDEVQNRQNAGDHESSIHNRILWNLFSQGFDILIIKLMKVPEASNWSATMVQLIALLYKDQHVGKLQKSINAWLDSSLSESSEDNESNTSPLNRGSSSTSPILTTDQTTSDSSDNGIRDNFTIDDTKDSYNITEDTKKIGDATDSPSNMSTDNNEDENNKIIDDTSNQNTLKSYDTKTSEDIEDTSGVVLSSSEDSKDKFINITADNNDINETAQTLSNKRSVEEWRESCNYKMNQQTGSPPPPKMLKLQRHVKSDSDCGYATLKDNRKSSSSSSNEDERNVCKPAHIKPKHPKQKANTKIRINYSAKMVEEKRRKKMVRRRKSNILNVQGLQYLKPSDYDIALVLKEFTVDFMLKGYNSLVKTLHTQSLSYNEVEIDRCHFFWLLTYFLKFAAQMELELEHVESVLSFGVISFLTAEGVNLCEQFELAVKYNKADLSVWSRKLHLVVTAVREFVQTIDTFKKVWSPSHKAYDLLIKLQMNMWETEELRSLMVLLIRNYNSEYHDKQYLQDLVVTNHLLLLFLDNVLNIPDYTTKSKMIDHLRQFATPHMMWQYGELLEDFETNGEFVNDCVFTIMHHVGGEVESLTSLYRTNILHAFSAIKQSDYEICNQWTDLVEYVLNSHARKSPSDLLMNTRAVNEPLPNNDKLHDPDLGVGASKSWTEGELSALGWNYMQSKNSADVIGSVVKLYKEEGILKSRSAVNDELYQQNLIDKEQHNDFSQSENAELNDDEVRSLCEELTQQGYGDMLEWVQNVLLEICYVKICLAKIAAGSKNEINDLNERSAQLVRNKFNNAMSPVVYHNIILNKSITLVPWNCRQVAVCKDSKFSQLLSKLDFYTPIDSGMIFYRIPQIWTPDALFQMALKISNIDKCKLKFTISDLFRDSAAALSAACILGSIAEPALEVARKISILPIPEHCYRIQRFKQIGVMVHYVPNTGDTASVASNFSHMYVSDEDERVDLSDECRFCFHNPPPDDAHGLAHLRPALRVHTAAGARVSSHLHLDEQPDTAKRQSANEEPPYLNHGVCNMHCNAALPLPLPPPAPPLTPCLDDEAVKATLQWLQ